VEWEGGKVEGRYVLWHLWVPMMEFQYQSSHSFNVSGWPPLILFYSIALPEYQIFQLISENSAVKNVFYFILLDPILDHRWRGILLYTLGYGVGAVGSQ